MKISSRALAYISILAGIPSSAAAERCLSGSFVLEYEGECDRDTLVQVFDEQVFSKSSACEGVTPEAELDAQLAAAIPSTTIEAVCESIYKNQPEVSFSDILKKDKTMSYEKAFFLGHSALQEEVETTYEREDRKATSVLKEDGESVRVHFQGHAQTKKTEWPQLANFASSITDSNGEPTCTTNAAMCCWTKDRQAGDNNGNCAANKYAENCVDKNPGDNTDLCFVDLDRGEAATGNSGDGLVAFPGDQDQDGGEGAIHCHGLAWSNNVAHDSARYKGNNLFFVAMYDHMYQRGYVENVPGAPMCGCVEQMPTVTRSDCTEIDTNERVKITFDSSTKMVEGKLSLIEVNFNACQGIGNRRNDLWAHMGKLFYEGEIENDQWGKAGRVITNSDCKMAIRAQYGVMGLEYGYDNDFSTFTFVAGKGELKTNEKFGHKAFSAALFEYSLTAPSNSSVVPFDETPIIMRACAECTDTHKFVFYRRLTSMPQDIDLLYCLAETRGNCQGSNVWNKDFTLHSTLEDAVKGENAWKCPNDSFNYDAPYDGECSPSGARVRDQWTVLHWSTPPQRNVAFYVNKPHDVDITDVEPITNSATRVQGAHAAEYISEDVGTDVRIEGRVRLDIDGKIYMTGNGANVWYDNDNFQYYHKEVAGDFDITVKVASFDNIVNTNAKAGIMMRATTDPDSEYVYALLSGGNGLRFQTRSSKGNKSYNVGNVPHTHRADVWLRLVKAMENIDMYWSENGQDWTYGGSTTLLFPEDTYSLGLAVCSHDASWQSEATFENFVVNEYNFPSAAPSISVAPTYWEPNMYVGETQENVEFTPGDPQSRVRYDAGSGIDGEVDSFWYHTYQRPSSSAFEVVLSVDYFYAQNGAKGGVMIRDGTGVSASNAFIGVYPADNTGVIYQSRATEGGDTVRHTSRWVNSNKAFVKLSYDGGGTVVAQYRAIDSDQWEDFAGGTTAITVGDMVTVGVAVTGGGYDNYVDFRYSNFEITDL